MDYQQTPASTDSNQSQRLTELLKLLTVEQIRFCVARQECKTDKEAARTINISPDTVKGWNDNTPNNKAMVDEAVSLMAYDGVITALELRRRSLAEAMAVKRAGLLSDDEKIRQQVATELIEWELGKATQKAELTGPNGGAIPLEIFSDAIGTVYGGDPDSSSK